MKWAFDSGTEEGRKEGMVDGKVRGGDRMNLNDHFRQPLSRDYNFELKKINKQSSGYSSVCVCVCIFVYCRKR